MARSAQGSTKKRGRRAAGVLVAVGVALPAGLGLVWPDTSTSQPTSSPCGVAPHATGPAWMHMTGDCGGGPPPQVKRCVAGIGGSTLLGFAFGLPVGPVAGAFGGALGCAIGYIN